MERVKPHVIEPGADGMVLGSDDGKAVWLPLPTGDGDGGAVLIDQLLDVDTATAPPIGGQALVWDQGRGQWVPGTVVSGTSGLRPTVAATSQVYLVNGQPSGIITDGTSAAGWTGAVRFGSWDGNPEDICPVYVATGFASLSGKALSLDTSGVGGGYNRMYRFQKVAALDTTAWTQIAVTWSGIYDGTPVPMLFLDNVRMTLAGTTTDGDGFYRSVFTVPPAAYGKLHVEWDKWDQDSEILITSMFLHRVELIRPPTTAYTIPTPPGIDGLFEGKLFAVLRWDAGPAVGPSGVAGVDAPWEQVAWAGAGGSAVVSVLTADPMSNIVLDAAVGECHVSVIAVSNTEGLRDVGAVVTSGSSGSLELTDGVQGIDKDLLLVHGSASTPTSTLSTDAAGAVENATASADTPTAVKTWSAPLNASATETPKVTAAPASAGLAVVAIVVAGEAPIPTSFRLEDLIDVELFPAPADGDVLVWDDSAGVWRAAAPAPGGGSGGPGLALVPLTTIIGGEPELVWTHDHQLVLTEETP